MNLLNKVMTSALLLCSSMVTLAQGTLLIKVHYQGEQYDVVSVKHIPQTLPSSTSSHEKGDDVLFRFSDDLDATLAQGRIQNPKQVRPVLMHGEDDDHVSKDDAEGVFMLRYPYQEGLRFLQLMDVNNLQSERAMPAPTPKIDLQSFIDEQP